MTQPIVDLSRFQATGAETCFHGRHIGAQIYDGLNGRNWSLKDYEAFLKTNMLPQSTGDFRLGAENYRKKLLYEEMVDTPLDHLLAIGSVGDRMLILLDIEKLLGPALAVQTTLQ